MNPEDLINDAIEDIDAALTEFDEAAMVRLEMQLRNLTKNPAALRAYLLTVHSSLVTVRASVAAARVHCVDAIAALGA